MSKYLWFFYLILTLTILDCHDHITNPGAKPVISGGVIDISNTGTAGSTFGYYSSAIKSFETFNADSSFLNITGIDVKIKKNSNLDKYNNITVELYEVGSNRLPANLLSISSIDADSVSVNFKILHAPVEFHGLIPGTTYAIVLGQSNANSIHNAGFEWCRLLVDSGKYRFGNFDGAGWTDDSRSGSGWLKVYVNNVEGQNEFNFPAGTSVAFFDDFQRTTGLIKNSWLDFDGNSRENDTSLCDIARDNGNLVARIKTNMTLVNGDSSWTDYTVSAKLKTSDLATSMGLSFRIADPDNYYSVDLYTGNILAFTALSTGTTLHLASDTISYDSDKFYELKAEVSGNRIRIYFNGILYIDYTDALLSGPTHGKIGLFGNPYGDPAVFDNVLVSVP